MRRRYTADQRSELLHLVTVDGARLPTAAARIGVTYSTAARWVRERQALREQHVRPLMTSFFDWARAARAITPGRNLATKALGYAVNQEAELLRVLDDEKLPLDNTRAERALRKIVVGGKNWMFYGSDTHAEAAAAIFSVMASCRLHKLDPYQYLEEVLRVLPSWPRDRYLELAPKYWHATRGRLRPEELSTPISTFEVPPALDAVAVAARVPAA